MSKLKLFLILASALLISCANPNDPDNGNDTGTGGGTGGGGTGGGGNGNPSWFLTADQQSKPLLQPEVKVFTTTDSTRYRIPAIIVANNGNIVALADDRHNHGSDIGFGQGAIDIVYRISKDGGKTWGDTKTILPKSKTGNNTENKGDPLVFKAQNGDLVVLAVSGGAWFSGDKVNSEILMSRSKDHGETWTPWKVEQNLWKTGGYGAGTLTRKCFAASGRGYTAKDGKLMAAMLVKFKSGGDGLVSIYSDDDGETWNAGGTVESSNGKGTLNEPKIMTELDDGTIVMTVRNYGQKNRLYAISKDGGQNWGTRSSGGQDKKLDDWNNMHDSDVNAEGVRWTSKSEGHDKNRIVHILSDGPRRRVGLGLYVSEDEAQTFKQVKKIEPDSQDSCYSSIDILPDGTVIVLYEKNGRLNSYDLVFKRFNLYDLSGGREIYKVDWYKKQ